MIRTRRHEVRAAERREEVIERFLVGQVDDAEPDAQLRAGRVEQIIHAEAEIEEMPRRDSRWVVHVVLGAVRGNDETLGPARGAAAA